jgi:hypothetical protein
MVNEQERKMANPNRTVAQAAARRPFNANEQAERDVARVERSNGFAAWCVNQVSNGMVFESVQAAMAAFESEAS